MRFDPGFAGARFVWVTPKGKLRHAGDWSWLRIAPEIRQHLVTTRCGRSWIMESADDDDPRPECPACKRAMAA